MKTVDVEIPPDRLVPDCREEVSDAALTALRHLDAGELEAIEQRVTALERDTGRQTLTLDLIAYRLALLEDRLHKVETQELNEVDERLCRLESPPAWEIDPRATAKPSKTSKGSAAPTRVFECRHCSADPCVLHVDVAAVVPDRCPYCNSEANWQELRSPGVSK